VFISINRSNQSYLLIFPIQSKQFRCFKHHWSDTKKSVTLEITAACIYQRDANTNRTWTHYDYKDIEYIAVVSDVPSGFLISHGGFGRLRMFQCEERDALVKIILEYSANYIGVPVRVKKDQILSNLFHGEKFGRYRYPRVLTTINAEFFFSIIFQFFNYFLLNADCVARTSV
jgi:DnaJ family protein C protein 13